MATAGESRGSREFSDWRIYSLVCNSEQRKSEHWDMVGVPDRLRAPYPHTLSAPIR